MEIDIQAVMKKFRVFKSSSLFPLSALEIKKYLTLRKCPVCLKKLYIDLKGNGRCKSIKCGKFFIKAATLKKYLTSKT